jgi:hypothetical protein
MIVFVISERQGSEIYDSGTLGWMAIVFLITLVFSMVRIARGVRRRATDVTVLMALVLGSGPFWGAVIGQEPNVHGPSMLLIMLYALASWVFGLVIVIFAVRRTTRYR